MSDFSLIAAQDRLVADLRRISTQGVGLHRRRSRAAVLRRFEADLRARGYSDALICVLAGDAQAYAVLVAEAEE